MLEYLAVAVKYRKQIAVSFILILLTTTTVVYRDKYKTSENKRAQDLAVYTLEKEKQKSDDLEKILKLERSLRSLQEDLRKSEQEKQDAIQNYKATVDKLTVLNGRLLNQADRTEKLYTSEDYTTNEKQVRYIGTINQLYREALQDGAEASTAVE